MSLSGKGMLITMMNMKASEEPGFNDWYDKEHLAERVAIEGFTEARRYLAVDAKIKYLNLYTTHSFEVLDSPQYQQALANQSERSNYYIERFEDSGRAVVKVSASHGRGHGSVLLFAALRPYGDKDALRNHLNAALVRLTNKQQIISAHLVESDPVMSKPLTADVPPTSASDWYLMLDGTNVESVRTYGESLLSDTNVKDRSTVEYSRIYEIMWSLPKNEL